MKSSISFLLVVICAVVLAAQQSQAKKGCNAYGHACYGGHGKRSLGSLPSGTAGIGKTIASEQDDFQPDAILQLFPNEAAAAMFPEGEMENYPTYRLIKIMKSWFGGHLKRPVERTSNTDYSISDEVYSRDGNNVLN